MTLKDSHFCFEGNNYKHADVVAMCSYLPPVIANPLLDKFDGNLLDIYPIDFEPRFYERRLDDTFIIFNNEAEAT